MTPGKQDLGQAWGDLIQCQQGFQELVAIGLNRFAVWQ
jgi:hypothetical protein